MTNVLGFGAVVVAFFLIGCGGVTTQQKSETPPTPTKHQPRLAPTIAKVTCNERKSCTIDKQIEVADGSKIVAIDTIVQDCLIREYWLVRSQGAMYSGQLLEFAEMTNDKCDGDKHLMTVKEDKKRVVFWEDGAFEGQGASLTRVVSLSPLRVVKDEYDDYKKLEHGTVSEVVRRDWETFQFRVAWKYPVCGSGDLHKVRYPLVPFVTLSSAYMKSDWSSTAIGACGLFVDGTKNNGFLHRGKANKKDASFRVVGAQKQNLFIEVHDNHIVGKGVADHLTLTAATVVPYKSRGLCSATMPEPPRLYAWTIRIFDGQVTPSGSASKALPLRATHSASAKGQTPVRIKLSLPADIKAFTVTYSDSDDGKTIERTISTSPKTAKGRTELGQGISIPLQAAQCSIQNSKLTPIPMQSFPADKQVTVPYE